MGFECSFFSHVSSDLSDKMVMFLNSSQASFVHAMCWLLADISQILLVYCPGIDLTKNLSRTYLQKHIAQVAVEPSELSSSFN